MAKEPPRDVGSPVSSLGAAGAAERYRVLLEINNTLISSLSREGMFQSISQTLRQVVPFDRAALYLFDPIGPAIRISAMESWGPPPKKFTVGQEIDPKASHVGWVVEHRRPLRRSDLAREREYPIEDQILAEGFRAFVVAPLMARGQVIGTLNLGSRTPEQYSEADEQFLQEVANQVALAVENSRAYEATQRLNLELDALLEINRAVGRRLDRDQLFGALAVCLKDVVPTKRFGIELPIEGGRLQGHILTGRLPGGEPTQPTILPASGTVCDWVLQNRAWFISATREELRERFPVTFDVMSNGELESLCALPLASGERCRGALFFMAAAKGAYDSLRQGFLEQVARAVAIALDDCLAYEELAAANEDLKREMAHRKQAEETLQSVVEGTAAATGKDFFMSLVRHVATALKVRIAFVTECTDDHRKSVRTLAFWNGDDFGENIEYDLNPTPCLAVVAGGGIGFHPRNLQQLFPGDVYLPALKAEAFLGVPMEDSKGQVVGHLAVMDDKPMEEPRGLSILQTFAARAGAELARLHAEEKLRAALAEVESLRRRLEAENVYLQEEIRREHNFVEMVGNSPALLEVFRQVESVAPTDATVLIYGETGTGKELIARAIHDRSARCDRPLVKVNCSAISAGLVESELFGHVKGAFTGAVERRVGRFELADGGTIFLDEVGELPLETQVKLLRVLQEQEFEPVGSSKTQKVDVRILAATNRDLAAAVEQGRFRSDLYYRLNVVNLHMPPLRQRQGDVPLLAMYFIERYAQRFGKKIERVSRGTMELLLHYAWPGNVRELQNVIERAVVLSRGNELELGPGLLPAEAARSGPSPSAPPAEPIVGASAPGSASSLAEVEKNHILAILRQTEGVVEGPNGAAQILNLHPNTLRSRMKKLGIKKSAHGIS